MTSARNPERGFMSHKKKNEKRAPTEIEFLTFENVEKVSSIRQWNKGRTLIVGDSMLAGIEQKRIPKIRVLKFSPVQQLTVCTAI